MTPIRILPLEYHRDTGYHCEITSPTPASVNRYPKAPKSCGKRQDAPTASAGSLVFSRFIYLWTADDNRRQNKGYQTGNSNHNGTIQRSAVDSRQRHHQRHQTSCHGRKEYPAFDPSAFSFFSSTLTSEELDTYPPANC